MSAPRYYLEVGLTGTDFKYRMKLKTRVGDHKGLQQELDRFSEVVTWEKYSENFVNNSGGLAKMEREWNRNYAKLVGHDHHNVRAEGYWELVENEENSESHELLLSLCDLISNGHSTSDILKSRTWNERLRDYFERTESEE